MKINQITYYNKELEWRFEPIHFSDITLLVGISGVGKTQILKSIINLGKIAKGRSLNGVEWEIDFCSNGSDYRWKGVFEAVNIDVDKVSEDIKNDKYKIISECLYFNEKLIIDRTNEEIRFKGSKLPKLSPFKSAVEILSEEEDVAPVKNGFNKLIYSDQSRGNYTTFDEMIYSVIRMVDYESLLNKYHSLEKIQESNLPIQIKLALTYNHEPEIFKEIKERFISIFEYVEDIKIEPDENENLPKSIAKYPFISIKEKGITNWIKQNHISSGMFRTLMHISELYLSAEGTVILIDEFENSLGINCIDILSDLLLEKRKLQFIITSHHPYIINKIGMEHWKIVTRKGGVVIAKDVKDFDIPKSRHQAFMQLMNLDEYREGIAV